MEFEIKRNQKIFVVKFELFEKIQDLEEIVKHLLGNDILHLFLNPAYIVSLKSVLLALHRAIQSIDFETEVPYKLLQKYFSYYYSPTNSNLMKIEDEGPKLIVLVNFKGETGFIKGDRIDLQLIDKFIDYPAIKKLYGLSEEEVSLDTDYRGAIYNYIALKKEFHKFKK